MKSTMKQMMRELKAIAKQHGFTARIYTHNALGKDSGYTRNFSHLGPSGNFDELNKRIIVRKYRNTFMIGVLFVLAHEIGHLLHHIEGKYPRYYSEYWRKEIGTFYKTHQIPEKLDVSCFLQGIRAERDCDKWARKFLKDRGFTWNAFTDLYPVDNVMGHSLYQLYIRRNSDVNS